MTKALYQVTNIRMAEQIAMHDLGLTEYRLMELAGASVFAALTKYYPTIRKIVLFCGCGNNAGDGYILARIAVDNGYSVMIHQYKDIDDLPPAAFKAAEAANAAGVIIQDLEDPIDLDAELIIDAILGIGLQGVVRNPLANIISQINLYDLPILAIDIPSGLNADTGSIMGVCVRANLTVTFIANKLGMFTLDGPDYCGKIICATLDIENCLTAITPPAYLLDKNYNYTLLPKRLKNSYKSLYGHVLIIGGGMGMPGAVYLAAEAALRVGAGMVTIATNKQYANQALPMLPEAMIYGIEHLTELLPLLARVTVCVIGPGLGLDDWASALFTEAISAAELPMIIDASALRILATAAQRDDNWILTPHPGEAAAMLNCSTASIQKDRFKACAQLQEHYGGNIVLKGHGTIVKTTEDAFSYICQAGNPGMATAGMGDVLSGVIAGLAAQGLSLAAAAKLGVWLHARAGDLATKSAGEIGLLASDLIPSLHRQINKISQKP